MDDCAILQGPREKCGVFGVYDPNEVSLYDVRAALSSIQHRGQESAGAVLYTEGLTPIRHVGMGLAEEVFRDAPMLEGRFMIGHTRYSTFGGSYLRCAQPFLVETSKGFLSLAHNGNLTEVSRLKDHLSSRGITEFTSDSDSELILRFLQEEARTYPDKPWSEHIRSFMGWSRGAYSLVILTSEGLFGVRDPKGFRPLCLGSGNGRHVIASETCALDAVEATYVRDVEPGEIVHISSSGVESSSHNPDPTPSPCVFEYVYFSRMDSAISKLKVSDARLRMGRELARSSPVEADVVVGVPDSATPSALGFAIESGLRYVEGLLKNHAEGRSFIEPTQASRLSKIRRKYQVLPVNFRGQRVVLVDDSVVRGNTIGPLIELLRSSGATEVHVRVASPALKHPCFMGVAMATYEEFIAHNMTLEEIREHTGADSFAYLSLEGLKKAVGRDEVCHACFSGQYPIEVEK